MFFFSQSPWSHPDNGSRIKTGLQECKYFRNSYIHFTEGVPILPPHTPVLKARIKVIPKIPSAQELAKSQQITDYLSRLSWWVIKDESREFSNLVCELSKHK